MARFPHLNSAIRVCKISMIDIREVDLLLVKEILRRTLSPSAKVFVFGSRSTGRAERGSDLDLAIDIGRALTMHERGQLEAEFSESVLPYTVDIVDLITVDASFRDRIA